MKAKLLFFFALILFLLLSTNLAKGSTDTINLQVVVLPNILAYFDGKDVVAKTNDLQPVVIAKEKIQSFAEAGYKYTIVPSL